MAETATRTGGAPSGKQQGTLSNGKVLSYAFGDVANNLSFQMTSMFLMVYMTDIAGIGAGMAGAIYGITKIWAGFSDLLAGQTVDRFDTRWGRLRPWIAFGSPFLVIVFVLLFSAPASFSPAATIAWIFVLDMLFQLAYSFVNIPYGSLASAITQDSIDRSRLSGARSIASAATGVALAAVIAPQFQDVSGDDVRMKFTMTTLGLGVVAIVLYLLCFANTKEVVPRGAGKISLKRTFGMLKQNKPLITLCLGAFFLLAAMFTMNAVAMYFAKDVLGNAGWYVFLTLAQTVGTILIASMVPMLSARMGKRNGYLLSAALAVAGFVLIYFIPAGSLPVAIVAWFLFGLGTGGTNALMFSMQADTVDYGEWKSGVRAEGGSYSVLSFIRKCGQGIGGWGAAALIGAFGYVGGAAEQTEQAVHGIRLATGLLPAALAVLAALVMMRYDLSSERHRSLITELNARRSTDVISEAYGVDEERVVIEGAGDGRHYLLRPTSRGTLPVITIFELEGAGASDIGPAVAKALGVQWVEQAFSSDEVADVDMATIRSDNAFSRWLRNVSYTGTQDSDLAQASDVSQNHSLAQSNRLAVMTYAKDGAVIRGRNGAFVLANAVGAVHVRLTAPMAKRAERVAHKTGLSPAAAEKRIRQEDQVRAEMSRALYRWDPNQDESYDLVINTASVTYDTVVEMIVEYFHAKYGDPKVAAERTEAELAPEIEEIMERTGETPVIRDEDPGKGSE